MRQKINPRFSFKKFIHQMSLSGMIIVFLLILVKFAENLHASKPNHLPATLSAVELYSNQTHDPLATLYQQAIAGAKESITLVMYSLTDMSLIRALREKCEMGIPVHLVCDPKGSKEIGSYLTQATIVKRFGEGLMHQKILVIDQEQIWIGSANFTPSSLYLHGNLVMGLYHPHLAKALVRRAKTMDEEGRAAPLPPQMTEAGNQQLEYWTLPNDEEAVDRIKDLIKSAKKTIKIAMFFWTRQDFTQEVVDAAKKGIQVEVVVDINCGRGSGAKVIKMLQEGGIKVGLSTSQGLLHHKFAYIDESLLVNGSANWTARAFKDNDDFFTILYPLTDEQKIKMDNLWKVIQRQSERPDKY